MAAGKFRLFGGYDEEKGWAIFQSCFEDICRLQLYHLFYCLRCGDVPAECKTGAPAGRRVFEFATAAWTPFYNRFFREPGKGYKHNEPEWFDFTGKLEILFKEGDNVSLDTLVQQAFPYLSEKLKGFLINEKAKGNPVSTHGAFSYNINPDSDYVALHFHNVHMPVSPFSNMTWMFQSLKSIIDDIGIQGLRVNRIGMDSWLNSIEALQACFPPEYTHSITATDIDNKAGNGWWGQFIGRTGNFNSKYAQELKDTGKFRYPRSHAECLYTDLVKHVEKNL